MHIDCNDVQLFADQAELFTDLDRMTASGNVVFVSPGNRISAERMEFNTRTKTGTFYNASGIANIENRGIDRSLFGSQEPDAYFWGEELEKLGPRTYKITHGGFTTCTQPTPRWEFVAGTVKLTLEKRAVMTNALLKVKDVPVFYLPGMYYPINKEDRATGFLIPIYGASTINGHTLRNAFFWAIDRSHDATIYGDYFSKTGYGYGGEYRYIQSPSSSGNVRTYVQREHDAAYEQPDGSDKVQPGIDSYQINGSMLQAIGTHVRLSANANYFSSLQAQQRSQVNLYAATTDGATVEDWCHVYRYAGPGRWEECGRVGRLRTRGVGPLIVHRQHLYAATWSYDWTRVDERIARSNITSLVAQVGKHPALYGFYLRDEPPPSYFAGLGRVAGLLREADNGPVARAPRTRRGST